MKFEDNEDDKKILRSAKETRSDSVNDLGADKHGFDAGKWLNKEVRVRAKNKDGITEIENGWSVIVDNGKGVAVFKEDKDNKEDARMKTVSYEEFMELNADATERGEEGLSKEKIDAALREKLNRLENDREKLLNFLDTIDGVHGLREFFKSADLKIKINKALDTLKSMDIDVKDKIAIDMILATVTNGGGLREKVHQIFIAEKLEKI